MKKIIAGFLTLCLITMNMSLINADSDIEKIPDLILSQEEINEYNEYLDNLAEYNSYLNNQVINKSSIQFSAIQMSISPGEMASMGGALAGSFFIPGVGPAVITAAGAVIVAGITVSASSALGKKVSQWVFTYKFKKSAQGAVNKAGQDKNKVNHIITPKHNWEKFYKNPKWHNVGPLIVKTLEEGKERHERANIYVRKLIIAGKTVEVRFIKNVQGLVQAISTAWVK